MRWVFVALAVLGLACGKKDATKTFWTWFAQHAAELRAEPDLQKTMEKVSAELAKLNEGVFAEIGKDGDNRLLVISVDGKKELFPIVERIYAARPEVPGWKIAAFRQRDTTFAIEMNGKKVEFQSLKFVARPNADKLDVDIYMPAIGDRDQMAQIGFVMLDHAVGEYDMEMKIAGIDFQPLDKAPEDARPLTELPAAVDATK